MKKLAYLILLLPTFAIAGGHLPPAPTVQAPPVEQKCPWTIYAGFGAGANFLRGKRDFKLVSPPPEADLVANRNLDNNAARIEGYVGAAWNIPNTNFWLGIEPSASYTNVKDNDFHNLFIVEVLGVSVNEATFTTVNSKYAFGVDFRPSYNFNSSSIYALIGSEVRHFNFRFQERRGSVNKTKHLWAFSWGVGYEYRLNDSSVGLRLRHNLFKSKDIDFDFNGSSFNARIKPDLYSVMLTYKYHFKG